MYHVLSVLGGDYSTGGRWGRCGRAAEYESGMELDVDDKKYIQLIGAPDRILNKSRATARRVE